MRVETGDDFFGFFLFLFDFFSGFLLVSLSFF